MSFALGFALGSLAYCIARRRADRQLILALSERCRAQSELLRKRAERVEVRASRNGSGRKPRRNKFGNVRTVVDGRTFDSKKEARRYLELKRLQAAGAITALRLQVRFPLRVNGVAVGKYVADFVYVRDGRRVVEDVKGVRTAVYKLKCKLMLAVHGIEILET